MANAEVTLIVENPEEKAEATLLAENPKEKVTSNNPDSSSKDTKEESAVEDNHEWNIFSQMDEIPKKESFLKKYWGKIFVASCLCGVLVDPLFFYLPIIKDDVKCLFLDQKLKIAAVILRSVTDLFYILDIIFRIYGFENYSDFIEQLNRFLRSLLTRRSCVPTIWDILIDILAILPLPQVVILIFFSNMRDLRSLTTRMFIMNLFALLQYVPRVFRIYLSCSELKRIPKDEIKHTPIWIKAILNFSMYIIASHVFGAVWYFFAIQRMMDCWHFACRKEDGCDSSSFDCHDHHRFTNIKILNDLCPINPSNAKMFDLGIFTSVLESGITGSTNYFQKFSNCFWWGLRNLSSLGSNLQPSVNGWENLFTTSISIIGLLLFLYLIGNLQMYMQFENAKREEHNRKLRVTRKMEQIGREIELWLFKNGFPTMSHKEMKSQVSEKVQAAIEGNMDVNLDDVLPILRSAFQSRIKKCTLLIKLKQVFSGLDEIVLKEICQHLEPKKFMKNHIIIEGGKPLEVMVFIVDGLVDIENRNSDGSCNNSQRGAGELCGQDLLLYGSRSNGEYAKASGDVEALVIMAEEMESVRSRFGEHIRKWLVKRKKERLGRDIALWFLKNGIPTSSLKEMKLQVTISVQKAIEGNMDANLDDVLHILPLDFQRRIKKCTPLTKLKQVFSGLDEIVLKEICQHLEPKKFMKNHIIIEGGKPLEVMVFIVDGLVDIENRNSDGSCNNSQRGAGELCGQDLLLYGSRSNGEYAKASGDVEALVIMAEEMESVRSRFGEHIRKLLVKRKKEQLGRDIALWFLKNGIPTSSLKEMKLQVTISVQKAIEGNMDANLDDVLHILPLDFQRRIKKCTPLTKLKQVFSGLDEIVLKEICQHLEPKKFIKNHIIIEGDKPLEVMVFIVDGLVDIENRNSDGSCNNSQRGAGELCGQDILLYGSRSNGEYAKAFCDVEALVIMAEDMEGVRSRFGEQIDAYERYFHDHKSDMSTRQKVKRKRIHDN